MQVHYLEIVTKEVDAVCAAYAATTGVQFGKPDAGLGNARTAALPGGGLVGVRAPMRQTEEPVVWPYWLVDDIEAAVTPSNVGPLCLVQSHSGNQEHRMSDLDPTEITEQMLTFHAQDVAEQAAW